jgi:tubulin-like protein
MANLILFIGLGGTGTVTLLNLKKRLLEYYDEEEVTRSFAFQYIDTDREELNRLKSSFSSEIARFGKSFFNEETEYLWVGGFVPRDIAAEYERRRSSPERMREIDRNLDSWLDDRASTHFSQQVITKGADANRQLGRFCLMVKESEVVNALAGKINNLNSVRHQREAEDHIQVYVVTSCCGGTGSSMFYDVLFICNRVYKDVAKGEPQIHGVIFSPFDYIRRMADQGLGDYVPRYKVNAWAFFEELEYAFWDRLYSDRSVSEKGTAIKSNSFNPDSAEVKNFQGNWKPFASAFIVDSQLDTGKRIPQNLFIQNVASALFYTITSSGNGRVESTLTNDPLKYFPKADATYGTARVYHTFGYRALEYPHQFFRKYFQTRFAHEALGFGLLRPLNIPAEKIKSDAQKECDEIVFRAVKRFKDEASLRLREDDGQGLIRNLSIASFCKPRGRASDDLEVDPKKVNDATLSYAIEEVRNLAHEVKQTIHNIALEILGTNKSDTAGRRTAHEQIADGLRRVLREAMWQYGVKYLSGESLTDGSFKRGILAEIDLMLTGRYFEGYKQQQDREEQLKQMLNATDGSEGLEQLKQKALESIPGFIGRATGGMRELERALKAFNNKRQEYIEEYFERELLGHELKLLLDVAAADDAASVSIQRTIEGFEVVEKPLVDRLEDQVKRIKTLLTPMEGELGQAYTQDLPKEFKATENDLMTQYLPNLSEALDSENRWLEGTELDRNYRRLCEHRHLDQFGAIMKSLLDIDNNCRALGFKIEDLCAAEGSSGEREKLLLRDRIESFVEQKFFTDQEVRDFLHRPLVDVFLSYPEKGDGMTQETIRKAFTNSLATMTMEEASVVKEGEIIVYSSADGTVPDPASIARKMGYNPDDPQRIQYVADDQMNRHRIVALKIKPNFVKEELKNFVKELQSAYNDRKGDQPHLSKEWNINGVLRTTEKRTLEQTLMKGLAFHMLLRNPTYGLLATSPDLSRRLFTDETAGYDGLVQDSPIYLELFDELRKKRRLVACPAFGGDWLDEEGKIRLKTKEGLKSLLVGLAEENDKYEAAIASLSKYPFIERNIRLFEEKLLKALVEAFPSEEERKQLFEKVKASFDAKRRQFETNLERGDTSRYGDLNTLLKMQKELGIYVKEIFQKNGEEEVDTEGL